MDQLGSVGNYFPWGEDKGGTSPQDTWNFATYWRDSWSGLDYARNRYYSNAYGRFMTPDPSRRSAKRRNPQSWNRYAYVLGDPVNHNDPTGLTDWNLIGTGSVQFGAGLAGLASTLAADVETGGIAALLTAGATWTSAANMVFGSVNIIQGLTSDPSQNGTFNQNMSTAQNYGNPGGLVFGVLSGGSQANLGSNIYSAISIGNTFYGGLINPNSLFTTSIGLNYTLQLGEAGALACSVQNGGNCNYLTNNNAPVYYMQNPNPTVINVDGGQAPTVDTWTAPINDPGSLTYSGAAYDLSMWGTETDSGPNQDPDTSMN
jgi:RHS repeat-associated protein